VVLSPRKLLPHFAQLELRAFKKIKGGVCAMTAKQILDSFSETLMQDERILSPQERELLTSLLQNSRAVSGSDSGTQSAVAAAIARSVGETVAQRAFALLGSSIVEQILARSVIPAGSEDAMLAATVHSRAPQPPNPVPPAPGPKAPQPPNPVPPAPGPKAPQPPNTVPQPLRAPQPPNALHPQHGFRPLSVPVQQGGQQSQIESGSGVGILDSPEIARAQCVVLDEFLTPQELDELLSYALRHEEQFQSSEVISPNGEPGMIAFDHRRSRVLLDLGKHEAIILERIQGVLPQVLDRLGIEEFPVTHTEAQITASNDGDFFRAHSDDSDKLIASRRVTFVYFFHREPRQFEGGELLLHDSQGRSERHVGTRTYQTVVPQQNQIVFFPCSVLHEITPVECPSRAFADSRFTLNGWLHK
jgi:Rps23 Pro-64 3,4-dihydroxylase Tpa1-like proline 4-hydroxylase